MKLREIFSNLKYSSELNNDIFVNNSYLLMIKGLTGPLLNEQFIKENISKYIDQIEKILIFKNPSKELVEIKGKSINIGKVPVGLVLCQFRRNPRHLPRINFYINGKSMENVLLSILPFNIDENVKSTDFNIENSITSVLTSIQNNRYVSIQERIDILGKIDDTIRDLFLKKYPNIKTRPLYSQIACCNEFCPEREKYIKIVNGQLSIYEKSQGYPGLSLIDDDVLIIKDYTRSAADQNIPLPYEIRTLSTLTLLMNHICKNILNTPSFLTPQWFNFIYDCTRAMRKELSQLNILNFESVELLEEISRFHIFCIPFPSNITSDPTNRDNTLGLQHSLGLLRDFYIGVALTNELSDIENYGEFCAYQVLFSFDDCLALLNAVAFFDAFYDKRVITALKIRRAYDDKNYYLFFKYLLRENILVSSAMFSNIMNLRVKSLRVILNVFLMPKSQQQSYKLDIFKNFFKLDDKDLLNKFITELGGTYINEDTVMFTNKKDLGQEAFNNFTILPSEPLIERKITTNLCNIVSRRNLDNNTCFPISKKSFDSNGQYTGSHFNILFDQSINHSINQLPPTTNINTEILINSEQLEKESLLKPKLELNYWPISQRSTSVAQSNILPLIAKSTDPMKKNPINQITADSFPQFSPIYSQPTFSIPYSFASTPFPLSNFNPPPITKNMDFQNTFQSSVSWPTQAPTELKTQTKTQLEAQVPIHVPTIQNNDISSFIKYSTLCLSPNTSTLVEKKLLKSYPNVDKTGSLLLEKVIKEYIKDKALRIVSKLEKAANLKINNILFDTYNQYILKKFINLWHEFTKIMISQRKNPRYNMMRKRIREYENSDILTKKFAIAYDSLSIDSEKYWWNDFLITDSDLINTYLSCLDHQNTIPPNTIKYSKFLFIFPDDIKSVCLSYAKDRTTFALMIWVKLFHMDLHLSVNDIKGTKIDSRTLCLSKNGFNISITSMLESSLFSSQDDIISHIYGSSGFIFITYNPLESIENISKMMLTKLSRMGLILPSIYLHHIHILKSSFSDLSVDTLKNDHYYISIESTPEHLTHKLTELFDNMIKNRPIIPSFTCLTLNGYINQSICNELIFLCIRLPEYAYSLENIRKTSILLTDLMNGYFDNIKSLFSNPIYELPLAQSTIIDIDGLPPTTFNDSSILLKASTYISLLNLPPIPSSLIFDSIDDAFLTILTYIEAYFNKPQIDFPNPIRKHIIQKCQMYGIHRLYGKFYIIIGQIIKIVIPVMINLLYNNKLTNMDIWIPIFMQNLGQTIQFDFPQYFELEKHINLISQNFNLQSSSSSLESVIDSSVINHLKYIKMELARISKRKFKRQSI